MYLLNCSCVCYIRPHFSRLQNTLTGTGDTINAANGDSLTVSHDMITSHRLTAAVILF